MICAGETRDVANDFGEDYLCGVFADAGDTGPQFDSAAVWLGGSAD